MHCKWYVCDVYKKDLTKHTLMHSSKLLHHYMIDTTFIMSSNPVILPSKLELMMLLQLYFSLTLVWLSNSAIPQLIYTPHTPRNSQSLVLFYSYPSIASKDMLNCVMMTQSLLPTLSYFQHAAPYLGLPLLFVRITRQSSRRRYRPWQKSCAKAYPLLLCSRAHFSFLPTFLFSRSHDLPLPYYLTDHMTNHLTSHLTLCQQHHMTHTKAPVLHCPPDWDTLLFSPLLFYIIDPYCSMSLTHISYQP